MGSQCDGEALALGASDRGPSATMTDTEIQADERLECTRLICRYCASGMIPTRFRNGPSWIHRGRVLPADYPNDPSMPEYAEDLARAPEVNYDCAASPLWERGHLAGAEAEAV